MFWRLYGILGQREDNAFKTYIATNKVAKLHLGCGSNYLAGWLNTDLIPDSRRVRLDVEKRFPYPDATFDYAYSEHMIEHLPYPSAKNMVAECFRTMKPGGTIRLVTPDMQFLVDLYQDREKQIHRDYVAWNAENFIRDYAPHDTISVINNFVRDWGHKYIFDVPSLTALLQGAGFTNVRALKLKASDHPALQNLEHEHRQPEGFLALESMVLEATKPL